MNQLHPPFNNDEGAPGGAARREPGEVHRRRWATRWTCASTHCATFFICGSPNETDAGAEPFRKPDVAKAKQLLAEGGYKGEKVVRAGAAPTSPT